MGLVRLRIKEFANEKRPKCRVESGKTCVPYLAIKNRGWLVLESLWTDNRSYAPVETGSRSCKSQVSDLSRLYRAVIN